MGNPEARYSLDDDADHDAEHGGAAIKALNALELIHVDLLPSLGLQSAKLG